MAPQGFRCRHTFRVRPQGKYPETRKNAPDQFLPQKTEVGFFPEIMDTIGPVAPAGGFFVASSEPT